MKQMQDKFNRGDLNSTQVDVRPSLSREQIYPTRYPTSGNVTLNSRISVLGSDSIEIIVGGDAPAITMTLKFYSNQYQVGSNVSVTTGAGTAGKLSANTVSFSDLIYADSVVITSTAFVGGTTFGVWLGKKGLG